MENISNEISQDLDAKVASKKTLLPLQKMPIITASRSTYDSRITLKLQPERLRVCDNFKPELEVADESRINRNHSRISDY
jgi:hypothetical protein